MREFVERIKVDRTPSALNALILRDQMFSVSAWMRQHWCSGPGHCRESCSRPPGRLPRTTYVHTCWAASEASPV